MGLHETRETCHRCRAGPCYFPKTDRKNKPFFPDTQFAISFIAILRIPFRNLAPTFNRNLFMATAIAMIESSAAMIESSAAIIDAVTGNMDLTPPVDRIEAALWDINVSKTD